MHKTNYHILNVYSKFDLQLIEGRICVYECSECRELRRRQEIETCGAGGLIVSSLS